ncbi:Uncharacterised protein [Mycobacteroides abscessus subsp. abscessus]|nr:Uncharacterised protein [Mycobacteroides abscessus subsp. abscessus]
MDLCYYILNCLRFLVCLETGRTFDRFNLLKTTVYCTEDHELRAYDLILSQRPPFFQCAGRIFESPHTAHKPVCSSMNWFAKPAFE